MSTRPALRFDEESHRYFLGEREVPGISKTLTLAGILDPAVFAGYEWQRDRGTMVHLATELDCLGELNEETLDPVIRPYLEAWRAFRKDTGWENAEKPEFLVASELFSFATKIDRVGAAKGGKLTVLNIKSGSPANWHPIQAAGEAIAYAEWTGLASTFRVHRISVYLADNSTYKVKSYDDRNDFDVFRSAALVAGWKANNQKGDPR